MAGALAAAILLANSLIGLHLDIVASIFSQDDLEFQSADFLGVTVGLLSGVGFLGYTLHGSIIVTLGILTHWELLRILFTNITLGGVSMLLVWLIQSAVGFVHFLLPLLTIVGVVGLLTGTIIYVAALVIAPTLGAGTCCCSCISYACTSLCCLPRPCAK